MKVLVTGASGLLGRHLLERISGEHEVIALSRQEPPPAAPEGVEWLGADLSALDSGELPERVDAVVHAAQSERYRDFPDGAADIFAVNVQATHHLLEYARRAGAERFVLASTGGVYAPSREPVGEDGELAMPGPYFRSKRIAELLLESYEEIMQCFVLRPFFIYGPGPSKLLVSRLVAQVRNGETVRIDGDPGLRINPIFVSDAARAFERALSIPESGTFNVAGDDAVTVTELVELIADVVGRDARIEHRGAGPEGDLVASTRRMTEVLGVRPEVSLREGLGALVATQAPAAVPDPGHG